MDTGKIIDNLQEVLNALKEVNELKESNKDLQQQLNELKKPIVAQQKIMSEYENLLCHERLFFEIDMVFAYDADYVLMKITNMEKVMDEIKSDIAIDMKRKSGDLSSFDEKTAHLRNRRLYCAMFLKMLKLRKKELDMQN